MRNKIIIRILIFIVNFVLWACGILLIVFGSLGLANPTVTINLLDLIHGVSNVTNLIDVYPFFEGVAIFMIVLGSLLFFVGGFGCHAITMKHDHTMRIYTITLALTFACEIALIIYAAVFPPTENTYIQQTMITSLQTVFRPVYINSTNGDITYSRNTDAASWELLQSQSQCCGALGPSDFSTANISWPWKEEMVLYGYQYAPVPPSCCVNTVNGGNLTNIANSFANSVIENCLGTNESEPLSAISNSSYVYQTGCWFNVVSMIWQFDYIAIIIASCLMATQIVGMALSACVMRSGFKDDV